MAEWVDAMKSGPGVIVLRGAFDDPSVVDAVTDQFDAIIDEERSKHSGGDHFGKPGANDRVWNALEKLCLRNPSLFAAYYGNAILAMVSESWLGPAYQITSQVNRVNPGGAAQTAHRDYHLGFASAEVAASYPSHVHHLSPFLTLQGAVAHVDMPLESGPTLFLPHSQKYLPGYLAVHQPECLAVFEKHYVQLPLLKGDAVFFNPALIHAAGNNRTANIRRTANLLQVSSAFGRAMESVDREQMCRSLYPTLLSRRTQGEIDDQSLARVVAACAEGYPFPTNLDRDPPVDGLAPPSQQALMLQALRESWPSSRFLDALAAHSHRRRTSDEA
ncbi:MAG: phytanoyl-CoA dioxygenase family protein [Propionivibrio sp.]|nr:phytanoyl-CoA dioxygenase family protein [Propionivibrio sp.]